MFNDPIIQIKLNCINTPLASHLNLKDSHSNFNLVIPCIISLWILIWPLNLFCFMKTNLKRLWWWAIRLNRRTVMFLTVSIEIIFKSRTSFGTIYIRNIIEKRRNCNQLSRNWCKIFFNSPLPINPISTLRRLPPNHRISDLINLGIDGLRLLFIFLDLIAHIHLNNYRIGILLLFLRQDSCFRKMRYSFPHKYAQERICLQKKFQEHNEYQNDRQSLPNCWKQLLIEFLQ